MYICELECVYKYTYCEGNSLGKFSGEAFIDSVVCRDLR